MSGDLSTRRDFLRAAGAGAAVAAFPGAACLARAWRGPARRRPNFVFILVDDLGWKDLGCFGSEFYETPNIDRLAAAGVRFTDAYAACPVCSPTRASIMTGKYPARLRITDWIPGYRPTNRKLIGPPIPNELALTEVTIAEALKEAGYATFFAGKWHLGGQGYLPEQQGFDQNQGGHEEGSPPGGYYTPYKNPKLTDGPPGEYLPDRLTDESLRFLDAHGADPFLLFMSFYTVHTPIQACQRHIDKWRAKADVLPRPARGQRISERAAWTRAWQSSASYASMVYALDENVGRLMDHLEELGLSENTVVVFASDNGGLSTHKRGTPTCNLPLRAGKGWCYEGGIRTPLIIRAPGVTMPGTECNTPVTSTDFYPTILALAGLNARPAQHRDGLSLVPLLSGGKTLDREALFWHYPHHHGCDWTPGAAVRAGEWKLIEFYEEGHVELYNLKRDIGEQHDLAAEMPEKAAELRALLSGWQKRVGAKMPRPNPDYKPPDE